VDFWVKTNQVKAELRNTKLTTSHQRSLGQLLVTVKEEPQTNSYQN